MSCLVVFFLNFQEWSKQYRLKCLFQDSETSLDNFLIGIRLKLAIMSAPFHARLKAYNTIYTNL